MTVSSAPVEIWTPPEVIPHHHAGPCSCEHALAYIRVSQVGDREILISPDVQLDYCLGRAEKTNRRIVKIISDINKSGKTFRTRSVDQCIRLIERGVAGGVLVWKWSRWGRNQAASVGYIEKTQEVGGWVESATEDFDQKTAIGRFTRDNVMRIDQLLSEQIGENWQNAHARRRSNGLPHSGRKRFGYDYVPAAAVPGGQPIPARFTKNEIEAPVLEQLYNKFNAGTALRALTKWMNESGFRTAFGGLWTPQALASMLDTGFAAGLIRERSPELLIKAKGKSITNSLKTFDVWREGSHDSIITMAVWEKYKQRRLAQADLPPRARNAVHAMSALLLCSACARKLVTKYTGSKRQHQWVCPWTAQLHPGVPVSISDAAAQSVALRWLAEQAKPSSDTVFDQHSRQMYEGEVHPAARTRVQVNADIKRWLKKIDNLVNMRTDGEIDRETFLVYKADFEAEVASLREELTRMDSIAGTKEKPPYEAFGTIASMWSEATPSERHALLEPVIKFVVVSPANGRGRWHDAAERVEVVGVWQAPSWERWLAVRRTRILA